jgi:DNA-binding PucR family transcriptional regulator
VLVPGADTGETARLVAKEAGRALGRPVTAGAAGPSTGPADVGAAHREADQCVRALVALGRAGAGAGVAELGYVGLLLAQRHDVGGFLRDVLGPVLDYDRRRGTALVQTLDAYFAAAGSLARAAETLHVHVNTVSQRLDRIAQLLGVDWHDPDRSLDLRLALRLHRLRGSVGPDLEDEQ